MSKQSTDIEAMRHTAAHVLATAVQSIWPHAKFGVGPVVENGFYYDIDLGDDTVSDEDFARLESKMKQIIDQDMPMERLEMPIKEALEWAASTNQPYKQELLHDLQREGTTVATELSTEMMGVSPDMLGISGGSNQIDEVSFYRNGDFVDLCRGPHVDSTGKVGAFKLMRVSGAYWRGNEHNPQMQRIYGVAFSSKTELVEHLKALELAKTRDHRILGEKLKLFFITPDVGAGLPLLMPRGETLKRTLMDYMRNKEEAMGYQYVSTPVLTQKKLYERSGHIDYYTENMYVTESDEEGNQFFIKPMNCPHHHMIYEKMVTSYRDLPLRLSEHAGLYRYELSGTLTGLIRMRGPITQNDSHTYVTQEQLKDEFRSVLAMFQEVYREVGIEDYWFRLSLPDFKKDKFAHESQKWESAAKVIRDCLEETDAAYVEGVGEAAFYGPKLDVQIRNVLGKEDTIATVQIDILVPERMGLVYVDANGQEKPPLVIHKSIMGAFERFMAILLEKTGGNLPVWLSPEQLRIITVNQENETVVFAERLKEQAKDKGIRVTIDNNNESVGKKIRQAELLKVPYTLVIGEKEMTTGKVVPRVRNDLLRGDSQASEQTIDALLVALKQEVDKRAQHTTVAS